MTNIILFLSIIGFANIAWALWKRIEWLEVLIDKRYRDVVKLEIRMSELEYKLSEYYMKLNSLERITNIKLDSIEGILSEAENFVNLDKEKSQRVTFLSSSSTD